MRKSYVYLSIIFILSFSAYAQKEAYNWFYGTGQGITWNRTQTFQGKPIDAPDTSVSLTGMPTRYEPQSARPEMYPIDTGEGCFSLSDERGKLLFYSDGMTIYNSNHQIMENGTGLTGNESSAQSGIIVPYPGNANKYIAVSIGVDGAGRFTYNVIDMQANNGLGKLELPKNRSFTMPTGARVQHFVESVTATKHSNGVDYWIVSIQRSGANSKMVAWLLTRDGISTNPITSFIPNIVLSNTLEFYGYLKISSNGKYFALMLKKERNFLWGEFDNSTGLFSNIHDYYSVTRLYYDCYGGEFSPNNKYFYINTGKSYSKYVCVYDFQELLRSNIIPVKTFVMPDNRYTEGALQLGPDHRLYMTMYPPNINVAAPSLLYLFDKPNEPLVSRVYAIEDLAPSLDTGRHPGARLGLPSFASSFFMNIRGSSTICVGEEAIYDISTDAQRLEVDFGEGDGPMIINNVNELKHFFKKPGNYLIKIRPLNSIGDVIQNQAKTIYTTVYSCYLPVNHNILNAEY